jgi:hypothetical protein
MIALRLLLIAILFLNVGCTGPNPGPCPPLKSYTRAENERLAAELEMLPDNAGTIGIIADYMALRDQVRACQ